MILLKKVRLINWYGFANITAPIGFFTLIAGKNGNGKSVLLDGIKYAAYGDTVFNKSSESKGSRTVTSYTRGLLDATAKTYIRPADKSPNVYSHIVLEYFDQVEHKAFVLGTVIETNAANNYQTHRYVMDNTTLDEMNHTYEKDGITFPHIASSLQKNYKLTLLDSKAGIGRFMQMTGMRFSEQQMPTYRRKLRSMMSYDPDARIDSFIRESVLEAKYVDFTKLIQAKGNIEQLNQAFQQIEEEIHELNHILREYDTYESEKNRLLADDIKLVYKKKLALALEIEQQTQKQKRAIHNRVETQQALVVIADRLTQLNGQIIQANISLQALDSAKMIAEEKQRLQALTAEGNMLTAKCQDLDLFQEKISEILHAFILEDVAVEKKEILLALCSDVYTTMEKEDAVETVQRLVGDAHETQSKRFWEIEQELDKMNQKLAMQAAILDEAQKHKNTYGQIQEYVGLRDEINREFAKSNIQEKAQFACEYVIDLVDEAWRDAIEAFLGPRRYTILVDPQYYDIADDVLNRSQYKYAHLFNTKLLMRKTLAPEADSVVHMLKIKNPVAKQYFAFQLGRMHGVNIQQVRNYENAISKEGRVSVALDSYFLRFDRIKSYYLGHQIFALNGIRAQNEMKRLQAEKQKYLSERVEVMDRKNRLSADKEYFKPYDYKAHQEYQAITVRGRQSKAQIDRLEQAQANNSEYMELSQLVSRLEKEQSAVKKEQSEKMQESSDLETTIQVCENKIGDKAIELEAEEEKFNEYEITAYSVVQRAVESYKKYLESDKTGSGGLLASETRARIVRSIKQHQEDLIALQAAYGAKHADSQLPVGDTGRDKYAARRDQIQVDNLQEIRNKLQEQTKRYEDIFKNEFVLTILKNCENAQENLRDINTELSKLNFSAKYQFEVHYAQDSSEYATIINYAKYLDEREHLGGTQEQMALGMFTQVSDEQGKILESNLKKIINRIIDQNSEEAILRLADYRNYMTYEILMSNAILNRAKLSRQTGFNSGAEVQIPYLLILSSALLMIYNKRVNSTRLVFIDEPFAKMDPGNVKIMLDFMRQQNLQVIFCSPDKTESIGSACEVILPVLRVQHNNMMQLGIVQFHKELDNE